MEDNAKKEDSVREGLGCILSLIAWALLIFLMYHGDKLAQIVLDKLR